MLGGDKKRTNVSSSTEVYKKSMQVPCPVNMIIALTTDFVEEQMCSLKAKLSLSRTEHASDSLYQIRRVFNISSKISSWENFYFELAFAENESNESSSRLDFE